MLQKFIITYIILCLCCTHSIAQQCYIDSIENSLKNTTNTYEKLKLQVELVGVTHYRDVNATILNATKIINTCLENKYTDLLSFTYAQLSYIYRYHKHYNKALQYANEAVQKAKQSGKDLYLGIAYFQKGVYYKANSTKDDSIFFYLSKAENLFEKSKAYFWSTVCAAELARHFAAANDVFSEINYGANASINANKCNIAEAKCISWIVLVEQVYHTSKMKHKNPNPNAFPDNSIALMKNIPLKLVQEKQCFFRDAGLYNYVKKWLESRGDYTLKEKENFAITNQVILADTIDTQVLIPATNNIESIDTADIAKITLLIKTGNSSLAEQQLLAYEKNINTITNRNKYGIATAIYKNLVTLYSSNRNYEKALYYQNLYALYYDTLQIGQRQSVYSEDELKQKAALETQKITTLQQKKSLFDKLNSFFILLVVLTLIALILMFRSYNFKERERIVKEQLLLKELEEIKLQTKLKEDAQQKAIIEKEIIDKEYEILIQENILSTQQKTQLQTQLLQNKLHLDTKEGVIERIKASLYTTHNTAEKSAKKINRIINTGLTLDEDFETPESFPFDTKDFYKKLQLQAKQSLTKLDLQYCAYIKMQKTTKEIAQLVNVEDQSIRMAKYRIKQKLQLGKDEDLENYIALL